jgi:hypothetical protein
LEEPKSLEDALQDFIIRIPRVSTDDSHPLYSRNLKSTLDEMISAVGVERNKPIGDRGAFMETRREEFEKEFHAAESSFRKDKARYLLWLIDQELIY